jgi:hypothetical protein
MHTTLHLSPHTLQYITPPSYLSNSLLSIASTSSPIYFHTSSLFPIPNSHFPHSWIITSQTQHFFFTLSHLHYHSHLSFPPIIFTYHFHLSFPPIISTYHFHLSFLPIISIYHSHLHFHLLLLIISHHFLIDFPRCSLSHLQLLLKYLFSSL